LVHLLLEVELAGDAFANESELDLRYRLEDAVEARDIGMVGGAGSGVGGMDISVLVVDERIGRERLAALVRELAPEVSFTIKVLTDE
jgi:hypothetical protein